MRQEHRQRMFEKSEYARRGYNFLHNKAFPHRKHLSSLMLYTTDLCDSGCKHCLIWAKRPPVFLSQESIQKIMESHCVRSSTIIGLEGGEFLLHPEAEEILTWFSKHHSNFDIFLLKHRYASFSRFEICISRRIFR